MRAYWSRTLRPMTHNFVRRRYTEIKKRGHAKVEVEVTVMHHKSRSVKDCRPPPETRREASNGFSFRDSGRNQTNPADTLISDFWPPER